MAMACYATDSLPLTFITNDGVSSSAKSPACGFIDFFGLHGAVVEVTQP